MVFVLALPFDIHVARVPVAGFGYALGSPVSPDAELRVAVPLGSFIVEQRIPRRFEWAVSCEVWDWGLEGHIVPRSSGNLERRGIVVPQWRLPRGFVEFCFDDFAVAHLIEDSLLGRQGAELGIVLGVVVEAFRQSGLLVGGRLGAGCEGLRRRCHCE